MDRQRVAAIGAQFTQALTSLSLGLVAVRVLAPAEFGKYSLIIATLLVMTGITTGLVGDSLTVLDRYEASLRYALQTTAVVAALLCAAIVGGAGTLLSWFSSTSAAVIMLAVGSFLIEDTMRRALMANSRFPAVLLVDLTYALVAAVVIGIAWSTDSLGLDSIFLAMAIGQTVAALAAVRLLPHQERYWARRTRGGFRLLISFGGWRATQGAIGPLRLWVARFMVAGFAGLAAAGALEANRMLVAPVMLAVQGLGSALLVSYTNTSRTSPQALPRAADRDALLLIGGSVLASAALLAVAPQLGRVLLGSAELVNRTAILGWGLVAVGIGASIPFTSVTAICGAPRAVVAIRLLDLALSLAGVAGLFMLTDGSETYVFAPAVLGIVVCTTALVQRWRSRRQVLTMLSANGGPDAPTGSDAPPTP